ncbi:hypothetical protein Tdes44962_MAKER01514 [Teratosphaeria destructans]|uniref:Uncharacterized protein n=1 Tax=Teratosphaeria destructans TaxID=418781 RepID=A0A9W7SZR1_9PEZI|nr:hypothetical protein Tdes44962_MAKER01514 [Teratosphaeria destructans]
MEATAPIDPLQTSYAPLVGPLTEAEIRACPMDECHRELALLHFRRISKIVWHGEEQAALHSASRNAAREQLARMTLAVCDYTERPAKPEAPESSVESMITDLCEAALCASGSGGPFAQPVFFNPTLYKREQEIAMQKQVLQAGSADDVIELGYTFDPSANVLPDLRPPFEDIAGSIDWTKVLLRSRSEDNILRPQYAKLGGPLRKERIEKKLQKRSKSRHLIHWPPVSGHGDIKLPAPRERTETDVSDIEHPGQIFRPRTPSNNERLRRGLERCWKGPLRKRGVNKPGQQAIVAANQQLSRQLLNSDPLVAAEAGESSPSFPTVPGSPECMVTESPRDGAAVDKDQLVRTFDIGLRLRATDEAGMFTARLSTLLNNLAGTILAVRPEYEASDHGRAGSNDRQASHAQSSCSVAVGAAYGLSAGESHWAQ